MTFVLDGYRIKMCDVESGNPVCEPTAVLGMRLTFDSDDPWYFLNDGRRLRLTSGNLELAIDSDSQFIRRLCDDLNGDFLIREKRNLHLLGPDDSDGDIGTAYTNCMLTGLFFSEYPIPCQTVVWKFSSRRENHVVGSKPRSYKSNALDWRRFGF